MIVFASRARTRESEQQTTPRLVSLVDAATYLGVSYWTVRELINRQELAAVRIGRRVMLDVEDLDRFIEVNKCRAEIF